MLEKAVRYDVKGKKYIDTPAKYYFEDGGVVETFETSAEGKTVRKHLEIDFIANKGNKKYYIQSAFEMPTEEKMKQEKKSLNKLSDSFKKFVIVKDDIKTEIDEDGLITMGVFEFLLNENSLEVY